MAWRQILLRSLLCQRAHSAPDAPAANPPPRFSRRPNVAARVFARCPLPAARCAAARCAAARRHRLPSPTSLQWRAKVMPTFAGRGIRLGIDLSILSCMVRHMPNQQMQLDRVFRALGDPTRRAVLGRLSAGPAPVSELARPFNIALPSFTQHLDVLERCGLVRSRKVGRVRTYRLVPQPLRAAERWITQQRAVWERRLDQLDDYLLKLKEDMR
jgi:DNA-binding transcriptional ArsR family regulator